MIRIVAISDTHTHHNKILNIENTIKDDCINILIHSGDSTKLGEKDEMIEFLDWFNNIKNFQYKFLISGNHDWCFVNKEEWLLSKLDELKQNNCIYLEDNHFIIETKEKNIKIYGSPWQPKFHNWAFNCEEHEIKKYWDLIPDDTDILITHGPPHYINDCTKNKRFVGCYELKNRIENVNLSLHVFGHIHEARNASMIKDKIFVNASICNENYQPINNPIIIDFNIENNNLIFTDLKK